MKALPFEPLWTEEQKKISARRDNFRGEMESCFLLPLQGLTCFFQFDNFITSGTGGTIFCKSSQDRVAKTCMAKRFSMQKLLLRSTLFLLKTSERSFFLTVLFTYISFVVLLVFSSPVLKHVKRRLQV